MPFMLFFGFIEARQFYVDQKYLSSIKWVLLEVIAPPEVEKSPKVAEQIFSALHAVYLPVGWKPRFFVGKVVDWFSFEIVSSNGEPHFYIRTFEAYKGLVESQIFAQYPSAEIRVVDDYVDDLPPLLPNDQYTLFGSELLLSQPNPYPIRTHEEFEEKGAAKEAEFRRTDPLASIFEVLSTLEGGEHIWIQILIRPTGGALSDQTKLAIDKILGKPEPTPSPSALEGFVSAIDSFISPTPSEPPKKEEKKDPKVSDLTPGKRDLLAAVEKKGMKLAYETGIRFMYIASPDNFHRAHVSGIFGFFRQFAGANLFKPNTKTLTADKGIFSQIFPSDKGFLAAPREYKKKWKMYRNYKRRIVPKENMLLNVEELATLWHLPGLGVKAPLFPRVDSKKGQPPSGLPIG